MRERKNLRKLTACIMCFLLLALILLPATGTVNALDATWYKSPQTQVLSVGTSGQWDDTGLGAASVIYDTTDSLYKMWYTGYNSSGMMKIGYATSSNGKTWTKYGSNPVVSPNGTEDAAGVGAPSVLKNAGTFYMWYTGYKDVSGVKVPQIFHATSANGTTWTIQNSGNPVLLVGAGGTWDEKGVHSACVIWDSDASLFKMWYTGRSGTTFIGDSKIGYATSGGGVVWTKYGSNPIISPAGGTFYQTGVSVPVVYKGATAYEMWFSGYTNYHDNDILVKIGTATSTDGITNWNISATPAIDKATSGWSAGLVGAPWVMPHSAGQPLELWYTGADTGLVPQIGYAATAGATLTCTATLQGDARDLDGMDVPLTLKLYTVAVTLGNILTATPVATYTTAGGNITITNRNTTSKVVTFTVANVPAGIFNATLFTPHALVNYKANVDIAYNGATVNMGELREGDAQDITESSTSINITDFNRFAQAYETIPGDLKWDTRADFNEDDYISIQDFTLLYTNYNKTSPQTV